jgi:glyoxylate reductase
MKPNAILLNTSRGPVVDEIALVEALRSNKIYGAGIDVFEFEPNLAEGLAEMENVVVSPHIGSATESARIAMAECVARNVAAALAGQEIPNPVK